MNAQTSDTDARPELPRGVLALVFTDIEGSTRLLEQWDEHYPAQLEAHRRILRAAFAAHEGVEVDTQGDAFFAVFRGVGDAIAAVVRAQRALHAHDWAPGATLRVRIGLHCGEPTRTSEGYAGLDLHRTARVMSAGNGGQILLSGAAASLVSPNTSDWELRDLGEHRLKDLPRAERIYELRVHGLPADFPPLRTLDNRLAGLPAQLTPILGRERDVETARALIENGASLLTLLGPGGTGKTRLGLEVAAQTVELWSDDVCFVPLALVPPPAVASNEAIEIPAIEAAIAGATARALGLRDDDSHDLEARLIEHLGARRMLLLLDNFEHLAGGAAIVGRWMARCPRLVVLATSRIPLHLHGEHEIPLAPLELPGDGPLPDVASLSQVSAVALFIARARAVRPDFALDESNAGTIAAICARLDGLPLAIELAAARIKLLPPAALLARLDKSLNFLVGGARDRSARQQTLRGAIAWSYDLLSEPEKQLFRRLAVFRGGFTPASAECLCALMPGDEDEECADVFEGIASLLDQSLLARRDEIEGEARFGMLETIREFALENLDAAGEGETARARHLEWCLGEVSARAAAMRGDFGRTLRLFGAEADNWRAAWNWSLGARPDKALKLAVDSALLWNRSGGTTENYERLQVALRAVKSDDRGDDRCRCRALQYLIQTDRSRANWESYRTRLSQLETLASAAHLPEFQAIALDQRMWDAVGAGEREKALQLGATILRLREACVSAAHAHNEDAREIQRCTDELHDAMILHVEILADADQLDAAWALMEAALALKRAVGDEGGLTFGLHKHAQLLLRSGQLSQARAVSEEVVRRARHSGDHSLMLAYYLHDAAQIALQDGDADSARERVSASYAVFKEDDASLGFLLILRALAELHEKSGDWPLVARVLGALSALDAPLNGPHHPASDAQEIAARAALGELKFESLHAAGARTEPQAAIEMALYSPSPTD